MIIEKTDNRVTFVSENDKEQLAIDAIVALWTFEPTKSEPEPEKPTWSVGQRVDVRGYGKATITHLNGNSGSVLILTSKGDNATVAQSELTAVVEE